MVWQRQFDAEAALDRAMAAFWSQGYAATSMQALVEATGLNRASLYNAFGGKRDLFLRALRAYDRRFRRARLDRLAALESPRAALARLFDDWVAELARSDARRGCFMTNTALELAPHDAEIGALVAESQRGIEDFLRQRIAEGQNRGEIRADLDPQATARGLLASLLGLLVLARSRPEPALLTAVARDALARLNTPEGVSVTDTEQPNPKGDRR